MTEQEKTDLMLRLKEFHGTSVYWRHTFGLIHYTDGVRYLAQKAGSYWLIDLISSWQLEEKLKNESFQVFHLTVNEDKTAVVKITDGDGHSLGRQELEFTDFPLDEVVIWCVDKIVLLPSEY